MAINVKDPLFFKNDGTGNWVDSIDLQATAVQNIIKIQPNQLQFLTDGIDLYQFLKSNLEFGVGFVMNYLKKELIKRGYQINNIEYNILQSGECKMVITLDNNLKIKTEIK